MSGNATGQVQILLAAGGTGGHMFPAEALAEVLLSRGCKVDLVTDERGQGFGDRLPQVTVHRVAAGGVAGKGIAAKLKNIGRLGLGYLQCRKLIRRLDPAVAVGFGGYPSVPPLLAAQQHQNRTLLHEQNAVAGRANRFLMKHASKVALSFERVKFCEKLPADKVLVTGNPVRPAIAALADRPYRPPEPGGPFHLLVFGGSLGARSFSQHVPASLALMSEDLRRRLRIVQQCRPEDIDAVAATYREAGIEVELKPFFDDMAARLDWAHLVLSRAGASTVAELTAAGRPAIMVPLPHAIDDHQLANARAVEERGGAWVLTEAAFSPSSVAERLTSFSGAPERLAAAAAAARSLGKRDAAARLADAVIDLVPASQRGRLNAETK
ncbi:UDP-N-acetylglucosamine-N-acetylmuramylpentapeptide N-acetylglucosamine transferase [Dongia mobilis]|uniref:UDP-N-acetylglucosamine--N-acetylmuramyl-(pentapeptide) pyrophosphoryl-undecaprenol N-acetylglucosamine transferase n=1 Tax=Dongia mobilis TaxID=578943 RepID=A0A4R6WVB6_9PROT|nr:undecaprenyldiphospho-muramoylpentapeptide beta-N-acetylglucosaminyltransferase [Dongia mobilis]TDQ83964.1 UDP-N-acetylglucosamine-N-acetylmuramylpentapeptide N-acetylglucosamine transferase [Dongia mobilis]